MLQPSHYSGVGGGRSRAACQPPPARVLGVRNDAHMQYTYGVGAPAPGHRSRHASGAEARVVAPLANVRKRRTGASSLATWSPSTS
eukprot:scaffold103052_cov29-Tisochrysis_lutea.AAC.4